MSDLMEDLFVEFKREEIERSVPERFEQQVGRYPERVAVKSRNHAFSYAALNQAANRVAWAILAQRGRGEGPIALLLEHDAPMIFAILGALKAGKIYVPLDPSYPPGRASYILEDSQASVIVTNSGNLSLARTLAKDILPLINVDDLDARLPAENLGVPISPDALTWILYTSGSTGQPKGVVQNHRNVLHFIMNYTNGLRLCRNDRMTHLSSCSVNAGAHDIFCALLNGASLYPLDIRKEGVSALADWLLLNQLTIYCSVPTVFRHFLETLIGRESFPDLRLIKLAGEPVFKRDVELYRKHFSQNCVFVNRLGSTETGSIRWYIIGKQTEIPGSRVPVGHPVEDNAVLILDEKGT